MGTYSNIEMLFARQHNPKIAFVFCQKTMFSAVNKLLCDDIDLNVRALVYG